MPPQKEQALITGGILEGSIKKLIAISLFLLTITPTHARNRCQDLFDYNSEDVQHLHEIQEELSLEERIEAALNSKDPHVRFEGHIAKVVNDYFPGLITEFQEVVFGPVKKNGRRNVLGEIDVGLKDVAIIEVTTGRGNKEAQLNKYLRFVKRQHRFANRTVILVAPEYGEITTLNKMGITVTKDATGKELLETLEALVFDAWKRDAI